MIAPAKQHTEVSAESDFVISRTFSAPRDLVFAAWIEREHLQHWFGPKGIEIVHCTNGLMHYAMRTPDGNIMWGKWIYREIVAPQRLVFVVSFSDENGGVTRHPMSAGWPLETLSTVTFEDADGAINVTVRWAAHNATALERETFDSGHSSMKQGWTGTFDQLTEYLSHR